MELLKVNDLVAMTKVSKRHVYELMNERTRSGDLREHPLPFLKLGHSVRFRKSDVEAWIEQLAARGK
jgi:predicted DNA-binding transcriptional regulator AlpA